MKSLLTEIEDGLIVLRDNAACPYDALQRHIEEGGKDDWVDSEGAPLPSECTCGEFDSLLDKVREAATYVCQEETPEENAMLREQVDKAGAIIEACRVWRTDEVGEYAYWENIEEMIQKYNDTYYKD